MPGIHHPTAPPDPAMLTPHPREACERDRSGYGPWRAEDQALYRQGYAAGYLAAILEIVAPLPEETDR